MRIAWTERAGRDLRALRASIAADNPLAAQAVALRILQTVERFAEYPASGRHGRIPNTRESIVPDTPVLIPYRIKDQEVEILGVIHGARRWPEEV